jgi:hypothetical protein
MRQHGVRCVDIGPKESADAMSEHIMKNMRYTFVAMVCEEEQMACENKNAVTDRNCEQTSEMFH